jgi:hypothetical protein
MAREDTARGGDEPSRDARTIPGLPAEPFIVYDPPYGGQSLRARRTADAWERVASFLRACTDASPSAPASLELHLHEPAAAEPDAWFRAARERAEAAFGAGTRHRWLSGASEAHRVEWRLPPDRLADALALLASLEPFPKATYGPVQLVASFRFRWVDPATRAVLPGQDAGRRAHPTQAASDLLVHLGPASSAILNARFPFATAGAEFVAYLRAVTPLLPVALNPARLRLWVPTPSATTGYRPRRIVVNEA